MKVWGELLNSAVRREVIYRKWRGGEFSNYVGICVCEGGGGDRIRNSL